MSYTEIKIKTPYLTFAAKQWGNPAGEPVLGLHGWLDNAATFDLIAPFFIDYNFIALDLAGHGRSGHRPPGVKYHYLDFVDDVVAVVDALGWDTFHLLGHSLGGGIATILAGTFPERPRSLAIIEAVGPKTYPIDQAPRFLADSVDQMKRQIGKKDPEYPSLETLVTARAKVSSLSYDATKIIIDRSVQQTETGYTWRSDPRLKIRSPSYATEEQIQVFLSQITAETLIIRGTKGSLMTRDELTSRMSKIRHLQQVEVDGGHHLHLDNPEEAGRVIIDFLTRQSQSSTVTSGVSRF